MSKAPSASESRPEQRLRLVEGLTREFLLHHSVCPKAFMPDGHLVVAVAPDAPPGGLEDVAFAYRCPVLAEPVPADEVERLIERLANASDREVEIARADADADEYATDVRTLANQPPVVRFVNLLLRDAYEVREPLAA